MAPKSLSSKLWQAAYKAILSDPEESKTFSKFSKVISEKQDSIPDLSSESGRKMLSQATTKSAANMESSSSPTTQKVVKKLEKFRGLIANGASANPCATIAVAGLFFAFDLISMQQAEEASISEIVIAIADISCRSELLHHFVEDRPHEHAQLLEARSELKAAFVQLKRTSLLLTMKIVYKLSSWRKFFLAAGSWADRLKDLKDVETRVDKYVSAIESHINNPPSTSSNWKDKRLPQLHRLVRDGRVDDVYKLLTTGQVPPDMLNERTSKGWTPLMFAVRHGQYNILTWLLNAQKIQVNATNTDGNTALILAVQNNRLGHTKNLVKSGAKLDVRNNHKRTAWLEGAIKGSMKSMKVLLAKGDDINQITGINGWCALHTAVEKDNVAMLKWLLENRGRVDIVIKGGKSKGLTPRGLAEKFEREKMLQLLPV